MLTICLLYHLVQKAQRWGVINHYWPVLMHCSFHTWFLLIWTAVTELLPAAGTYWLHVNCHHTNHKNVSARTLSAWWHVPIHHSSQRQVLISSTGTWAHECNEILLNCAILGRDVECELSVCANSIKQGNCFWQHSGIWVQVAGPSWGWHVSHISRGSRPQYVLQSCCGAWWSTCSTPIQWKLVICVKLKEPRHVSVFPLEHFKPPNSDLVTNLKMS